MPRPFRRAAPRSRRCSTLRSKPCRAVRLLGGDRWLHPGGTSAGASRPPAGTPADPAAAFRRAWRCAARSNRGCSTLLEFGDDTNDSATDFSDADARIRATTARLRPRPTARRPAATIDSGPVGQPNAKHECLVHVHSRARAAPPSSAARRRGVSRPALRADYQLCRARWREGSHTFQVRATNANGTGRDRRRHMESRPHAPQCDDHHPSRRPEPRLERHVQIPVEREAARPSSAA